MKVKATANFTGLVAMSIGQERDVPDEIARDLISAGYAEAVGKTDPEAKTPVSAKGE